MEFSPDSLKSLLHSWPSVAQHREKCGTSITELDYIGPPIPYSEFFAKYLVANVPCVIGDWVTSAWPSISSWYNEETGRIDWDYLMLHFSTASVPVANCKEQRSYSHAKADMKFTEFVSYMKEHERTECDEEKSVLYLKDWHCQRDFPDYSSYSTPVYFQSDWLNEFWDSRTDCSDDYRFVYVGPKGSWTPFHADVVRSFSWSANICGRKKWLLVRAGDEEKLKDRNGHLPLDVDESMLRAAGVKYVEAVQNRGEVLFVPSGWHHQVYNVEDTISINHNWLNAANVDISWDYVKDSLQSVEREIEEHRATMDNWTEHCQLFLKANIGMDYVDFYNLLHVIASWRLHELPQIPDHPPPGDVNATSGDDVVSDFDCTDNHLVYDLYRLEKILDEMTQPAVLDVLDLGSDRLLSSPTNLHAQVHKTVARACKYLNCFV